MRLRGTRELICYAVRCEFSSEKILRWIDVQLSLIINSLYLERLFISPLSGSFNGLLKESPEE